MEPVSSLSPIGRYTASVWSQYHPYPRAQETANKCDVRWVSLTDKAGHGIMVCGDAPLSVSAWNFPMEDIEYVPATVRNIHGGSIVKKDMVRAQYPWWQYREERHGVAEH